MRRSLLLTTALSAITCVLSAGPFSPVSLGIGPEEYFGTAYASPPIEEHPFMFYAGETIRVKVDFVNSGDAAETLLLGGRSASQLITTDVTKDDSPVPVQWRTLGVEWENASGKAPNVIGATSVTLPPGAKLTIHGELVAIPSEPGVYVVDVSTPLVDSSNRPVAPQSTRFDFELRLPRSADSAELSRRRALQALSAGQLEESDRVAAHLQPPRSGADSNCGPSGTVLNRRDSTSRCG